MVHWKCHIPSDQTPIRFLSDPIRFNAAPSFFQIPQCNLIQKGANLLPISFPSDSYQKKIWFFNAISILNQHTTMAAQPILNFRAKTATFITGGLWCTGNVTFLPIRLLSDSYQILSDSMRHLPFQIPQCNLIQKGANLLPTSFLSDSNQKKFWFFNAISILNQHTTRAAQPIFNFRAKTKHFYYRGVMVHWECHIPSYQTPARLLSDPIRFNEAPSFFRFLNAI